MEQEIRTLWLAVKLQAYAIDDLGRQVSTLQEIARETSIYLREMNALHQTILESLGLIGLNLASNDQRIAVLEDKVGE